MDTIDVTRHGRRQGLRNCGKPTGWMDTPISYSARATDERITHVIQVMESMPKWQREQIGIMVDLFIDNPNDDK